MATAKAPRCRFCWSERMRLFIDRFPIAVRPAYPLVVHFCQRVIVTEIRAVFMCLLFADIIVVIHGKANYYWLFISNSTLSPKYVESKLVLSLKIVVAMFVLFFLLSCMKD